MKNQFNEETATKLAGLQIDMLSKFRANQISLLEFEMFLNMKPAKRKQIFGINPWADQMVAISLFYKTEFPEFSPINWKVVKLPAYTDERPRLEYIHSGIRGCNDAVKRYHEKFGNLASNDYSQNPDGAIHTQQERPVGGYAFAWAGTVEPDLEHRKKSYNMFKNDGNTYMVPIEGIVAAYRYRCEIGDMLDVKGLTRFHATDSDGSVLCMFRYGFVQFRIDFHGADNQNPDNGPRQVNISQSINL